MLMTVSIIPWIPRLIFSLQSASFYIELASFQAVLANGPHIKNYLRYPRSYYCAHWHSIWLPWFSFFFLLTYNSVEYFNYFYSAIAIHFIYFMWHRIKNIPNLTGGSLMSLYMIKALVFQGFIWYQSPNTKMFSLWTASEVLEDEFEMLELILLQFIIYLMHELDTFFVNLFLPHFCPHF